MRAKFSIFTGGNDLRWIGETLKAAGLILIGRWRTRRGQKALIDAQKFSPAENRFGEVGWNLKKDNLGARGVAVGGKKGPEAGAVAVEID